MPSHDLESKTERQILRLDEESRAPGQALEALLHRGGDNFEAEVIFKIQRVQHYWQGPAMAVNLIRPTCWPVADKLPSTNTGRPSYDSANKTVTKASHGLYLSVGFKWCTAPGKAWQKG